MRKPLITNETRDEATLDHWKDEFRAIYDQQDKTRDIHKTWSMAYEDATRVAEAIRENNLKNCVKYLAHTFCWIASFVAKLEKEEVCQRFLLPGFKYQLSEIVWYKYPKTCPHCLKPSCVCPVRNYTKS